MRVYPSFQKFVRLVAAMLLISAAPATAGVIALEMQFSASYQPDRILLTASLKNTGDESAHDIRVEGRLAGRRIGTAPYEQLEPGRSCDIDIDLGTAPSPKGVHTIVVAVYYADGGGADYSDIRSVPVMTDPAAMESEPILCKLDPADDDPTALAAAVLSRHTSNIVVEVTFFAPAGLTLTPMSQRVSLGPNEETAVYARFDPRAALAGQQRFVIAVADTVIDGLHYSTQGMHQVMGTAPVDWAPPLRRAAIAAGLALALIWTGAAAVGHRRRTPLIPALETAAAHRATTAIVLAASVVLLLWHIPPSLLLTDTVITGGDVPAHNYLARHLADSLFGHGRIVNWAGGWWCGFPMFQFYFPLPYLLMAIIDLLIPFNIAFRIVYVSGMLALPFAAWGAGRIARLPRPAPALLALAATLVLYDPSHTMWGVNLYSTLAGMIANSISFPILLLFAACAARDAESGTFRVRTVLLLVLLYASHFFTTVMGILLAAAIPLLTPRGRRLAALRVLAAEGALGTALMAWWLIPLLTKRQYAMDFGVNWDVSLLAQMPPIFWAAAPLALYAAVTGIARRRIFVSLLALMLVAGVALFHIGFALSPVFVNIRLWPFITFALLALGATGLAQAVRHAPGQPLAVMAVALAGLACAIPYPNGFRGWAEWNFGGMENKPNWNVFRELVLPLDGTPGRLANDLHDANVSLGSSRAFEAVPFLIDKPILEGGLVNSAAGSMFSYYIQGETSRNSAGFPTIVHPAAFSPETGMRHLRLFNVKHFIARWQSTKDAFRAASDWRLVRACRGWELFEDTGQNGAYVTVLPRMPMAVATRDWKQAGLDWIYTPQALDRHVVILPPGTRSTRFPAPLDEPAYAGYLAARRAGGADPEAARFPPARPDAIVAEEVSDQRIRFTTTAVGRPHLIKMTWYPNWTVTGAQRVFKVTPCFMLVFPEQEQVELVYGTTTSDLLGQAVTALAFLFIGGSVWKRLHALPRPRSP